MTGTEATGTDAAERAELRTGMRDPERYRDRAEVERWRECDPIPALAAGMRADGELTDELEASIGQSIAQEIDRAVAAAEAAPLEPVEELTRFVYADRT